MLIRRNGCVWLNEKKEVFVEIDDNVIMNNESGEIYDKFNVISEDCIEILE